MNLTSPLLLGAAHMAEWPGESVASFLKMIGDSTGLFAGDGPDGGLGMVMSGLAGVATALAVAIVLSVYFRSRYRSPRDVLRHGLAAAAGARAGGLRGLRHAACGAGLSRHQSDQPGGRIRNPAAAGIAVRDRRHPGRTAYRPQPDSGPGAKRAVAGRGRPRRAQGIGSAGLPDPRPRRDPQSAGTGHLRIQAAAGGKPVALPQFGPWHLADRVASPITGEETRSQQNDAFAIRYRVL